MNTKRRMRRLALASWALLLSFAEPKPAGSQTYFSTSPVDLYETQVSLINPAAQQFQDAQLVVGSRVLHYGFLAGNAIGLRNTFLSVFTPRIGGSRLGIGFVGTHAGSPIFTQSRYQLLSSLKLTDNFAIGGQLGLLGHAFNRDQFVLVDENDPVFAEGTAKYSVNTGLGIFYRFSPILQGALGVDQLNRPNASFVDDGTRYPRVLNAAMNYRFGAWEASGGLLIAGARVLPMLSVSGIAQGIGSFRLGVLTGNLDFGAQMHVTEKISFDYSYSYPFSAVTEFSNGSHRISLAYRLGDVPAVSFSVFASVDSQLISEKRLNEKLSRIPDTPLSGLNGRLSGIVHAEDPTNWFYRYVRSDSVAPLQQIDFALYLEKMGALIEKVGRRLQADDQLHLRIIVRERKLAVARSFCDYLENEFGISGRRLQYGVLAAPLLADKSNGDAHQESGDTVSRSSAVTHFAITPHIPRRYNRVSGVKSWKLVIRDGRDTIVKLFQGEGEPPSVVTWDWTGHSGRKIEVGKYEYWLEWVDQRGEPQKSPSGELHVVKWVREIDVELRTKLTDGQEPHHRIDWHLGI